MDEILWELRDHSGGLNAGRWDYMFSLIKKFRTRPEFVLPDRAQVTMTVPFMRAYTELLVKTCHRRGAHALGGMAAFIPNRRDPAGHRGGAGARPGGQGPRVRGRVRRDVGGPPRSRPRRPRAVRPAPRGAPAPARAAAARGRGRRRGAPRRPGARRDGDRGRAPEQRERRPPVPRGMARRERRRRHLQPDGGRGDRRDLALPGLAVGAPRRPPRRGRPRDAGARAAHRGRGAREAPRGGRRGCVRRAGTTARRRSSSRPSPLASRSSSSSRSRRPSGSICSRPHHPRGARDHLARWHGTAPSPDATAGR